MISNSNHACVYIVRVWNEPGSDADQHSWRFTLITTASEQRRGFVDPGALCNALYEELMTMVNHGQTTVDVAGDSLTS
jgi:hypothetical protein